MSNRKLTIGRIKIGCEPYKGCYNPLSIQKMKRKEAESKKRKSVINCLNARNYGESEEHYKARKSVTN